MMNYSEEEKKKLLKHARRSICSEIRPGEYEDDPIRPGGSMNKNCGVFISLYVEGNLRGCIGTFSEEDTLFTNVGKMAVSAAMYDSRFTPIKPDELDVLKIEISILTPRQKIDDIGLIVPGKHGIFMRKGMNRGTLLPQVALDQNWTTEEFLGNCSKYKAGLGWEGWKTADLYIYEAIVFNSDDYSDNC